MADNIYVKLSKIRESVNKEQFNSFGELMTVINKVTKRYKVLPLYCFYENVATLTLVNMDDIMDTMAFKIPVELVNVKNVKQYLYKMAFNVEDFEESITPKQYIALMEKMKEVNVTEKEILERYNLKSLADITLDIYKRCMTVLDKMKNK